MLISVNEVINFKEIGLHITDRVIVIPFTATFTDDRGNRDINIEEKLRAKKSLQIIVTRAIQAFEKVLENGKFTIPDKVEKETDKYFNECNNAREFCDLYPIDNFIGKRQYYIEYSNWCEENNSQPLGNSGFGKVVISFGYGSKRYSFGGIRNTYYVNPKFDTERCYSFYNSFKLDKDLGIINHNMTFEEYLSKYLYLKERDDLEKLEEEQLKKFEPKEKFFE